MGLAFTCCGLNLGGFVNLHKIQKRLMRGRGDSCYSNLQRHGVRPVGEKRGLER